MLLSMMQVEAPMHTVAAEGSSTSAALGGTRSGATGAATLCVGKKRNVTPDCAYARQKQVFLNLHAPSGHRADRPGGHSREGREHKEDVWDRRHDRRRTVGEQQQVILVDR